MYIISGGSVQKDWTRVGKIILLVRHFSMYGNWVVVHLHIISKYFNVSFEVVNKEAMLGRVMWPYGQYGVVCPMRWKGKLDIGSFWDPNLASLSSSSFP